MVNALVVLQQKNTLERSSKWLKWGNNQLDENRIKSGIQGLDDIIEGGFLNPSIILLMGEPGSGKTIFSLNYLFEGAKHREKGIYFSTLSEPSFSLMNYGTRLWFLNPKLIGKKIFIIDLENKIEKFNKKEDFLNEIFQKIEDLQISRVVIDPINPIGLALDDIKEYRMFLFEFSKKIKEFGITALITAEIYDLNYLHCHEAYISDGALLLQKNRNHKVITRELTIVKMRGTYHRLDPMIYRITKNGITVETGIAKNR
ncbi:MAG: RAD55 family ATPase [Candidatus Helarchaeota archaeon]